MSRSVAHGVGMIWSRPPPDASSGHVELMARAPSPSVHSDPDAVDMESAEEGWRSEDPEPQRRGVAACCPSGVLSRPGGGAAPPACDTATRDVARLTAPHRHPARPRPCPDVDALLDRVDDPRRLRRSDPDRLGPDDFSLERGRHRPGRSGAPHSSGERVIPPTVVAHQHGASDHHRAPHHDAENGGAARRDHHTETGGARPPAGARDGSSGGQCAPARPLAHLHWSSVVVRRAGWHLREPEPCVRDRPHYHRPLHRSVGAVHGRRPPGVDAGSRGRPVRGYVHPVGERRSRCDRGAPDLVSVGPSATPLRPVP
jgi:hypothetical protein